VTVVIGFVSLIKHYETDTFKAVKHDSPTALNSYLTACIHSTILPFINLSPCQSYLIDAVFVSRQQLVFSSQTTRIRVTVY
jgi:hypothetical protein